MTSETTAAHKELLDQIREQARTRRAAVGAPRFNPDKAKLPERRADAGAQPGQAVGGLRRIYRLPVVGYAIKVAISIVRLPVRIDQLIRDLHEQAQRIGRLEAEVKRLERSLDDALTAKRS